MKIIETLLASLDKNKELTLNVKVHARARGTKLKSILADGRVKIDVAAAAEDGKGNDALISLLSTEFTVPKNQIEIISGRFSSEKKIRIKKSA